MLGINHIHITTVNSPQMIDKLARSKISEINAEDLHLYNSYQFYH